MDLNGNLYPNCPNAANPYHECGTHCLQKSAQGKGRKEGKNLGTKILDASRSFGRKKKGSDSQLMSPRTVENAARAAYPSGSLQSHFVRKRLEENSGSFDSYGQRSVEIDSRDQSLDSRLVQSTESDPTSGKLGVTALPALADKPGSVTTSDNKAMRQTPTKSKAEEKFHASPKKLASNLSVEDEEVGASSPSFSLSAGVNGTKEGSDDEEVESVISDSCVSVGKYHVKASVSTVLQSIFENYGDIAANCHLESTSMRAYYLECLCAVVQELESTPFKQLTKSKIKEMFNVLKDVESAGIDVNWLRGILNEISEAIEVVGQNQSIAGARATCHRALESTRKELEAQMEDLSHKEKEAADARERVADIKARLSQLELEQSRLDKTISKVRSVVKKYGDKPVANEVL